MRGIAKSGYPLADVAGGLLQGMQEGSLVTKKQVCVIPLGDENDSLAVEIALREKGFTFWIKDAGDPYDRQHGCQHDMLRPDTTIEVIDKWKAKCRECIEFFDLPGRPEGMRLLDPRPAAEPSSSHGCQHDVTKVDHSINFQEYLPGQYIPACVECGAGGNSEVRPAERTT